MTKLSELRKFDAAEHIGTFEAQAAFFAEAMETGDDTEIRHALNVIARDEAWRPLLRKPRCLAKASTGLFLRRETLSFVR